MFTRTDKRLATARGIYENLVEQIVAPKSEWIGIEMAYRVIGAPGPGKIVQQDVDPGFDCFVGHQNSMGSEPFGDRSRFAAGGRA
jgi:hypothetical protein